MPAAESPSVADAIAELITELDSLTTGTGWALSVHEACVIFGCTPADYYRFAYAHVDIPEASEDFDEHNCVALGLFAEALGHPDASVRLQRAGYLFSEELLMHWIEFFLSVTMNHLRHVAVDRELLESAMAGCRRFEDAAEFYCEAHFSRAELIDTAVGRFIEVAQIRDQSHVRRILSDFVTERFRVRAVSWDMLFGSAVEHLAEKATQWGLRPEWSPHVARGVSGHVSPELEAHLRTLQIPVLPLPDESQLREAYYVQIKKWHPDRNAQGNERTRRINEAYAAARRLLFEAVASGEGT